MGNTFILDPINKLRDSFSGYSRLRVARIPTVLNPGTISNQILTHLPQAKPFPIGSLTGGSEKNTRG